MESISRPLLEQTPQLRRQFEAGRPFRHLVLEPFFEGAFCEQLLAEFPPFDTRRALNENGEVGGKASVNRVRSIGPAYAALDTLVSSREFLDWVSRLTGIDDLQYDPYYFGGGTHENLSGQELDPHVDFNYHPVSGQHRRLNLIVYLNPAWEPSWGGALTLHRAPQLPPEEDETVTVEPGLNRCVIFETTEHSWHGFSRIAPPQPEISRRSFALYYYTRSRPAQQTADAHSTIYVERPLPPHYKPGLTLDESHLEELTTLLKRRDQHLERLYREGQGLLAQVTAGRRALYSLDVVQEDQAISPEDPSAQEALRRRVQHLEATLGILLKSPFWRLTAPLRWLHRTLRNLVIRLRG